MTPDNRLALDQLIIRCEAVGIEWQLNHVPSSSQISSKYRYQVKLYGAWSARAMYFGSTATHAASRAMAMLDEHKIGWEDYPCYRPHRPCYCPHCLEASSPPNFGFPRSD